MSIEQTLLNRSGSACELCKATDKLSVIAVPPKEADNSDHCIMVCATCAGQIADPKKMQINHWHCLNDSMWSQTPAVQVMAWRLLKRLSTEATWAQDALDMLYLEDDTKAWAEAAIADTSREPTLDSNGTELQAGDNVTIIKDLDVKGAGFTAKRGTAVRNISLTNNPEHIEGRVNGTKIVLLSCYLKKS